MPLNNTTIRGAKSIEITPKTKRRSYTSSAVKNRYNAAHYKQFSAKIKPDLMEEIDAYLLREEISKPEFLTRALEALTQK